ncbi:MAG: AraC family chitin signaling transcriptional activator, partial [Cyclobacteriaceae bacterium]
MPFRIILFFVGLFQILNTFSQNKDPYKYYSFPNVQANEVIKGIWKDSTGYIWLATDLGVLSYNGQGTSTFSQGLQSLYTKKFIELSSGQLVVLSDSGIQSISRENDSVRFSSINYRGIDLSLSMFYPKSIFLDSKGWLWIGETNAIVRVDESGISRFEYGSNQNYHRSFSFAEDAFGNIWAASYSGLLLAWNKKNHKFDSVDINSPVDGFTGLAVVKGDHVIVGGNNGLMALKVDSDQKISQITYHPEVKNISILKLVNGLLIVGTWDKGLFYFDYDDPLTGLIGFSDIDFSDIVDIFHDKKTDELWVAGSENIALLKKTPISTLGETGKYRIESFVYDENRNLYFTNGEQVYVQNSVNEEKELITLMDENFYTALSFDKNHLWIGDHQGRIFKYSVNSREVTLLDDSDINFNSISYITKIGDKTWVTSSLAGIITIDNDDALKQYNDASANVIKQAPDASIYIAGSGINNVLSKFDSASGEFHKVKISFNYPISDNIRIEDIAFSNENIYLASNEGVFKIGIKSGEYYSDTKINFADIATSYSSRAVTYVNDALWIGTNNGVFYSSDSEIVHYTTASGLPSRLIKQRGFSIEDNELIIATAKGMARIDLAKVKPQNTPQPILEKFIVGDNVINSPSEIMNIPHQANVEISFRCFTYPGYEIQYKTRLRGISDEWNAPSENQIISLFGISRGEYALEVMAKSVGQLWSEPVIIKFRVLSPWYLKWWAFVLFCVLAISIVAISIR